MVMVWFYCLYRSNLYPILLDYRLGELGAFASLRSKWRPADTCISWNTQEPPEFPQGYKHSQWPDTHSLELCQSSGAPSTSRSDPPAEGGVLIVSSSPSNTRPIWEEGWRFPSPWGLIFTAPRDQTGVEEEGKWWSPSVSWFGWRRKSESYIRSGVCPRAPPQSDFQIILSSLSSQVISQNSRNFSRVKKCVLVPFHM